jgi:hypothetical protein
VSIVCYEEREKKLDELIRPTQRAGEIAVIVGGGCVLMMLDKSVSWDTIAIVATSGLIVAGGFFLWGLKRITNAARGRC